MPSDQRLESEDEAIAALSAFFGVSTDRITTEVRNEEVAVAKIKSLLEVALGDPQSGSIVRSVLRDPPADDQMATETLIASVTHL